MATNKDKIETLTKHLRENPHDSFTKFALALEFLKLDQTEKSRKLFESIRSEEPEYVGVYYHLGKLYEQLGDDEKAQSIFQEGIEIAREQGESRTLSELQEAKSMLELNDDE